MAKEEKSVAEVKEEKLKKEKKPASDGDKKKKKKNGFIFPLIFLLLIIGLVSAIKFDIGGISTNIVGPKIKNLPGASLILPASVINATTSAITTTDGAISSYNFATVDEAVQILKVTENMLKEKEKEAETLNEQLKLLQSENDRLKVFETNQVAFEQDKVAFDEFIASSATPKDFSTWFAKMNPETAAKVYAETIQTQAVTDELLKLVNMYQDMKPALAAPILEEMSTTRIEMVSNILKNLDSTQAGSILGQMTSKTASKLTAYMYPQQ